MLPSPYPWEKACLVTREMADQLALDLVAKGLVTQKLTLTLGYDTESLKRPGYQGAVDTDRYGRQVPRSAHGTIDLPCKCASSRLITAAFLELFQRIADKSLLYRRLTLTAQIDTRESALREREEMDQLTLFDRGEEDGQRQALEREQARLEAMLKIKERYGKNAIFRGMNLEEGATARERNGQIGGHKA